MRQVLEQGVDGVLGVFLVRSDYAGRSTLDPANDVFVAAARDSSATVGDGGAIGVKRQARGGDTAIADGAHHQLGGQFLTCAGVLGHHSSAGVAHQVISADHDAFHLAVSLDLDGRRQETQHDPTVPRSGRATGVIAQHLEVLFGDFAYRGRIVIADAVKLGWVDDDVDAVELAEFTQLQCGKRALQGAAPTDDHHFLNRAGAQRFQRVIGDVGGGQYIWIGHQDARDVDGNVAVAYDDGAGAGQIRCHLLKVRVRVVPADEINRGDTARQLLAGNVECTVRLRTDGVDHRVVAQGQVGRFDMLAHLDVAEKAKTGVLRGLLELLAYRFDLGVIGRDTGTDQAPGRRQHLEHVDRDIDLIRRIGGFEQGRRRKKPGRAGTHNRYVVETGHVSHARHPPRDRVEVSMLWSHKHWL